MPARGITIAKIPVNNETWTKEIKKERCDPGKYDLPKHDPLARQKTSYTDIFTLRVRTRTRDFVCTTRSSWWKNMETGRREQKGLVGRYGSRADGKSKPSVTMSGSIFCVAKLDWQFIGNIRLRGVTPSLRVSRDRQKSPPLPLSRSLPLSASILSRPVLPVVYMLDASFVDPSMLWDISSWPDNDSVPAANAPQWGCSWLNAMAQASICIFLPLFPGDIWISLFEQRWTRGCPPLAILMFRYRGLLCGPATKRLRVDVWIMGGWWILLDGKFDCFENEGGLNVSAVCRE